MDFPHENYEILGFPKCGTQGLKKYLTDKGKYVASTEYAWRREAIRKHRHWHELNKRTWHHIIITRNNVDRLWSAYHYWPAFYNTMTFPEFLEHKNENWKSVGLDDPIECGNYQKWIDMWREEVGELTVIRLEDIKHLTPKINTTKKNPIPEEYRKLVLDKLKERNIPNEYPSNGRHT